MHVCKLGHIASRNGASRAVCRHGAARQAIRFAVLALTKALLLCAIVGCAAPQQMTIGEAYKIPQPHHALLQTHDKPECDFGAPGELSVNAKVADTWTPYSGKSENGSEKEQDAKTENRREDGPLKEAESKTEKEPQKGPEASADAKPTAETAEHAEHYALLSKERNCYQSAEANVRKKLHRLQSSVGSTLIALQKETTVRVPAQQQQATP